MMSEAADDAGKDLREPVAPRRPRERRGTEGDVAPTREALKGSPDRPISTDKGDVPEALSKRYFTQSTARALAFYAEYNAPKPAFRDAGARLSRPRPTRTPSETWWTSPSIAAGRRSRCAAPRTSSVRCGWRPRAGAWRCAASGPTSVIFRSSSGGPK